MPKLCAHPPNDDDPDELADNKAPHVCHGAIPKVRNPDEKKSKKKSKKKNNRRVRVLANPITPPIPPVPTVSLPPINFPAMSISPELGTQRAKHNKPEKTSKVLPVEPIAPSALTSLFGPAALPEPSTSADSSTYYSSYEFAPLGLQIQSSKLTEPRNGGELIEPNSFDEYDGYTKPSTSVAPQYLANSRVSRKSTMAAQSSVLNLSTAPDASNSYIDSIGQSVQPVQQAQPVQPVQAVQPAQPIQPLLPAQPIEPVKSSRKHSKKVCVTPASFDSCTASISSLDTPLLQVLQHMKSAETDQSSKSFSEPGSPLPSTSSAPTQFVKSNKKMKSLSTVPSAASGASAPPVSEEPGPSNQAIKHNHFKKTKTSKAPKSTQPKNNIGQFDENRLISSGVLRHQDLLCIKAIMGYTSDQIVMWFVDYLIRKELQADYSFMTNCLVYEYAGPEPNMGNRINDGAGVAPKQSDCEIVIKKKIVFNSLFN